MDFSSLLEYDKTLLLAFNNNHNMFLDHVVLVFTALCFVVLSYC